MGTSRAQPALLSQQGLCQGLHEQEAKDGVSTGLSYWSNACEHLGGIHHPGVVAPAHLHLSAEEGAKVSQPDLVSGALCSSISDVQNLQQVNMSWEAEIATVVHFLMYIWAREKILPLKALPGQGTAWWPQRTQCRAVGKSETRGAAPGFSPSPPLPL